MLGHPTPTTPSPRRNIAERRWDDTKAVYLYVWLAGGFAFIISPIVMALLNSFDFTTGTATWTVLVTFAILFLGLRPTNLAWSGIIGGIYAFLMDRDSSQGAGTGPVWLWRVVISLALAHYTMGLVATIGDFEHVTGGFMAVYLISFGFVLYNLKFESSGGWYRLITFLLLLGTAGYIAWESFNVSLEDDVFYQASFDPETGEPLKMGYITVDGDWIEDPKGRTPSECRPDGYQHFGEKTGKAFPYHTAGTCFSTITGERLVPIERQYVPDASRTTWQGLTDWLFKTPAEREQTATQARLKREAAEAAREHAEKVRLQKAEAQAAAELRRAAEAQAAAALAAASSAIAPYTTAECDKKKYEAGFNCNKITFNRLDVTYTQAISPHSCIGYDSAAVVDFRRASEDKNDPGYQTFLFTPKFTGAHIYVYEMSPGVTIAGYTCVLP